MDWTSYPVKSVLLDFTVTALNQGATITSPLSGSSSVNGQYGVTATPSPRSRCRVGPCTM